MIDSLDEKILHTLERNGRISNLELAGMVSLSPSACSRRVSALEEAGIISGYRAMIDRRKLGRNFSALIGVGLNTHSKASLDSFEVAMQASHAVTTAYKVSGAIEYILHVEVTDMDAFKYFHTEILGAIEGVSTITTFVVMDVAKSS